MSIELVDGKPKVEWEPKTNRWTGAEIKATLKCAERLEGPWEDVPAGGSPGTARPTVQSGETPLPRGSRQDGGSPYGRDKRGRSGVRGRR